MDIVERLRNCEEASRLALFKFNFAILLEAADEIERLRDVLSQAYALACHHETTTKDIVGFLDAALQKKESE